MNAVSLAFSYMTFITGGRKNREYTLFLYDSVSIIVRHKLVERDLRSRKDEGAVTEKQQAS